MVWILPIIVVILVILYTWLEINLNDSSGYSNNYLNYVQDDDYCSIEIIASANGKRIYPDRQPTYYEKMRRKYADTLDGHLNLCRDINRLYSAALAVRAHYDSPEMLEIIELCQKDIVTYAEKYRAYLNEFKYPVAKNEYLFLSFTRLAIIYEKQKDYDSALQVCNHAISLGYIDEGGKTDVYHRRSRLMRKLGIDEADVFHDSLGEGNSE